MAKHQTVPSMKDRWTPRRYFKNGESRYCSPACGGDCTWEGYKEAKARAEAARKTMPDPKRWTVVVKENLHWFSEIHNGYISIKIEVNRSNGRPYFWCLMTMDKQHVGVGDPPLAMRGHFRTAVAAFRAQMRFARRHFTEMRRAIESCEKALDIV